MTAQNTKTIQYRLRNGQSVEVTINNDGVPGGKVSISDLAIEKTIMCHLGFTEEVSKKHGVAIWRTMDTDMRKFITARTPGMTMMDLMQIAPLFECEPLDVFSNPVICQQLYGEMKLAVRYATAPAVTATKISVTNPNKLPDWRPSRTSIRNVPIPPITESRSAIATGANSCVSSTSSLLRCQEVMVCKVTSQPVICCLRGIATEVRIDNPL